ncbi:hypothetical protein PPACK8108_LOCUS23570 [Phakopsora pachyrhizi]|uniref:Uncharacterized protein n=1 Tax=Phakopsora pachyrhizi TaxID=170000 RepID=A0AAV0BMV7_PHAPC|nr:hypothetical protein PPACK8108_LOCUS23570 [Phakopsora pachyrhizi]
MRGPPASSSPTTRSDTLLPTTDINRNRMKESQLCDGDDSILSNPFDDSDFELDEMENLKLKKGALDKFKLPIDVIEGSVGSLLLSLIIRFYYYSRWPALGDEKFMKLMNLLNFR